MRLQVLPTAGRGLLLAAVLAAWALLAWLAFDMGHPLAQLTMPGWSHWSALNVAAIFAMWAVMMAAMMLPAALPTIAMFTRLHQARGESGRAHAFIAAYLLVWTAFAAAATALQWLLQWADWVDTMIASSSAALDAVLLLIAGAWQFSPLKRLCLAKCRTPVMFLLGAWRPGVAGAFAMGLRHGLLCAGCCWALMLLLFVGGAMNLAWVGALSLAVALEKLAPQGERIAAVLGALLLAAGGLRLAVVLAAA